MPPIPPMPPGIPPAHRQALSSGASEIAASVVIRQTGNRCSILQRGAHDLGRVDNAEPSTRFSYTSVDALKPMVGRRFHAADCPRQPRRHGPHSDRDLAQRGDDRLADDVDTAGLVVVDALHAVERLGGIKQSAVPPPGTMPSSTAARVACSASSTRSLRSFTSTSKRHQP